MQAGWFTDGLLGLMQRLKARETELHQVATEGSLRAIYMVVLTVVVSQLALLLRLPPLEIARPSLSLIIETYAAAPNRS